MSSPSEQEIMNQYSALRKECQTLAIKIQELQVDRDEHQLVINTLAPLDAGRKAFRLIGGVLVERTVGEVLPSVESNLEQLDSVLRTLDAQLQKRDGEVKALKAKYGAITERAAGQQGAAAGQRKESQGVLA